MTRLLALDSTLINLKELVLGCAQLRSTCEVPYGVPVLHGLAEGRDICADVAASGVPHEICAKEVLVLVHGLHLIHVVEVEHAIEVLEPRKHDVMSHGRPEQLVHWLLLQRLQQTHRSLSLLQHRVEADVRTRLLAMDQAKPMALRLPGEGNDTVLDLEHFNRDISLLDAEELKAVSRCLLRLLPVNFDTQVGAIRMPMHLDVANTEQIFLPELFAGGNLPITITGTMTIETPG